MALECERKYMGVNFAAVRAALKSHGAHFEGAHMESNTVWDNAERSLRPGGMLLRLRTQQWFGPLQAQGVPNEHGVSKGQFAAGSLDRVCHVLTFKAAASEQQGCKIREESEVIVDNVDTMEAILTGLGYSITARYEKVREVWNLHHTELALDIVPFGEYMEVEGSVATIDQVARLVGIDTAEQSTLSYHRLHQEWRVRQGLPPQVDFVFDAPRRAALVEYLQGLHA